MSERTDEDSEAYQYVMDRCGELGKMGIEFDSKPVNKMDPSENAALDKVGYEFLLRFQAGGFKSRTRALKWAEKFARFLEQCPPK